MATFDFSTLAAIPERAAQALFDIQRRYYEVELRGDLSREGKYTEQDRLISGVLNELDRLAAEAESEFSRIEEKAQQVLKEPVKDVQAQILHELQAQRTWGRIRRILDTAADGSTLIRTIEAVIESAQKEGNRAALSVLREELPPYLGARKVTAPQIHQWLDTAEVGLLTPEQREARKALQTLEENYPRVLAAIDEVRRACLKKAFKIAALPGWGNAVVRLNW